MIRIARRGLLHLALVLGLLFASGSVGASHDSAAGVRAVASAAASPFAWDRTPAADPDGSKASLWVTGGDDSALPRSAARIDWPSGAARAPATARRNHAPTTHPACAFPPRAPPHA
jgi:hypothetical protein